jgi:iron complex outermembrane receptor protein
VHVRSTSTTTALIRQPKLSVIYALTDTASLYGNWGRTFQVGVGAVAYKITRTTDLRPSINQGWEFGVKLTPAPWLDGRIAVWQQTASDEARRKLNDPANDRRERRPHEAPRPRRAGERCGREVDRTLGRLLATRIPRSRRPTRALPASQGKEIDHIPHHLLSSGGDWQVTPEALRLSAWLNAQTNYYLERANSTAGTLRRLLRGRPRRVVESREGRRASTCR